MMNNIMVEFFEDCFKSSFFSRIFSESFYKCTYSNFFGKYSRVQPEVLTKILAIKSYHKSPNLP